MILVTTPLQLASTLPVIPRLQIDAMPTILRRWTLGLLLLSLGVLDGAKALGAQVVLPDTVFARSDTSSTGVIRGTVHTLDGQPVANAQVSIGELANVRTNEFGAFFLLRVPRGTYAVAVRTFATPPATATVRIGGGDTVQLTIRLPEKLTEIEAVRAIGRRRAAGQGLGALEDFFRRRERGFGKFFTRDQIDQVVTFDQLLVSNIAGIRVRRNMFNDVTIDFGRCPPPYRNVVYFVDGMQTMDQEVFTWLRPTDIEAMEVYRGPAELPAEARGIACAAVYLWMRR